MNLFKCRSKSLTISESDPTYKVKYLGNILTTFVRGEGCVDRPLSILWNNYQANPTVPKEMQLTVTNSGLKAVTKEQGLMEYRCHRIPYCLHHPEFPKLFVWVYRHEGRKMKVEVRCHAVLCKSEAKAKALHAHLRDRLAFALGEFAREKTRRQNSRLILQRLRSASFGSVEGSTLPVRTQLLRVGQHFKPPASMSNVNSNLDVISEEVSESAEVNYSASNRLSSEAEGYAGHEDDDEEAEDDSVFLFQMPNFDCRLTDIPYFENNDESNTTSSTPDLVHISDRLTGKSRQSDHQQQQHQQLGNGISHRSLLSSSSFGRGTHSTTYNSDRTDPEEVDTTVSVFPESDDISVESGFSEQDAHDL